MTAPGLPGAAVLAGAAGMALTWVQAGPQRFWSNWILWFLFLATLGLGCLFLVALEHLVGAKWSVPPRRVPERLSTLLVPLTPVALIALDTWLQDVIPEHLRGRVFGARFTLTQGTYALSVLVGGALAGVFDVRALIIVAGVLMAIPGIAALFVRDIREDNALTRQMCRRGSDVLRLLGHIGVDNETLGGNARLPVVLHPGLHGHRHGPIQIC